MYVRRAHTRSVDYSAQPVRGVRQIWTVVLKLRAWIARLEHTQDEAPRYVKCAPRERLMWTAQPPHLAHGALPASICLRDLLETALLALMVGLTKIWIHELRVLAALLVNFPRANQRSQMQGHSAARSVRQAKPTST